MYPNTEPFSLAFRIAMENVKQERKQIRLQRLNEATKTIKRGDLVLMKNGITGNILRVLKTRFEIQGHDGRIWRAHPGAIKKI